MKALLIDRIEVTNLSTNSTSLFPVGGVLAPLATEGALISFDQELQNGDYKEGG